jgi:acyl carrier protein
MDDGDLRFLGRIDHQVKLRGFRIELGEIEAALEALPDVREAVALVAGAEAGSGRLVAFVVPDPDGGEPAPEAWREALGRTLPGYMVPGVFHRLDELPRLPNGKVDRNRLAQIAATEGVLEGAGDGSGGAEHVPPETDTERAVAAIWSEVLGRDGIGVRDDFFRIGGHSLLATRIMARIRRRLGADLPLRALFQHPTIRSLATAVDEGGEGAGDEQGAKPPAPTIRKVDRRRRHRSDVG